MFDVELGAPEWDYTPKFKGNDKADKPGSVRLRLLSVEEQEECLGFGAKLDRAKMFTYGVVEFKGFSVRGKPIKTAADVLETQGQLYGLFAEVWIEINNKLFLSEGEVKN